MTRLATQTLATYDLAPYAVSVSCFICDGGNKFDAEQCRYCQAPLALTYQSTSDRKSPPKLLAVLGPAGSGKTSYLGMLADILSRQPGPLEFVARGAFSVQLQQQSIAALARRTFPVDTAIAPGDWNWMHCQVKGRKQRRPLELIVPDMSGAALQADIEHQASPTIRSFLKKCAAAMILVDAERLLRGDQSPDFHAMKVISHLNELNNHRKTGWSRRPIAIVLTKADSAEFCHEHPARFVELHAPGLWRQCQQRLAHTAFFAVSVVGASVHIQLHGADFFLPLRVEPRGIVEPLQWLLGQLA